MTPQDEAKFFESLESQFPSTDRPATIIKQEDFELVLDTFAKYIPESYERNILLTALKSSYRDLFRLYLDLREIIDDTKK